MDQAVFFDWFSTLFVPRVEKLEGHKLLFLDGHASHISIPVIELAIEKKIEIICLPPIQRTLSSRLMLLFFHRLNEPGPRFSTTIIEKVTQKESASSYFRVCSISCTTRLSLERTQSVGSKQHDCSLSIRPK
jgi:hypothetical protein